MIWPWVAEGTAWDSCFGQMIISEFVRFISQRSRMAAHDLNYSSHVTVWFGHGFELLFWARWLFLSLLGSSLNESDGLLLIARDLARWSCMSLLGSSLDAVRCDLVWFGHGLQKELLETLLGQMIISEFVRFISQRSRMAAHDLNYSSHVTVWFGHGLQKEWDSCFGPDDYFWVC